MQGLESLTDLEAIKVAGENGVVRITLNRPERLNSFSKTMHLELKQALAAIKRLKDLRLLVLTGEGRGFCAGQDLEERRIPEGEPRPDLGDSLKNTYSPLVSALRELPVPTIAAVNGVAAGAGASIALACDIVIAKRGAKMTFPFSHLGLVPDAGATSTLVRNIGQARAMAVAMLGEMILAEEAEQMGLIWSAVDADQFEDQVESTIKNLLGRPALGLELIKRSMYQAYENSFAEQLELESSCQKLAGRNPEFWDRVNAFLNKK
ncbi:enoyl-CoA hydratase-related protein [Marinobacterium sp. LSUCC0821]|uniref:enoyl-CoA hydratase-related protein n=1 Tax=Marinobacterium sp. LSUCC0821 TaxID=2668067 RepID=UPI001451C08F|nr:enoyl-CoA hydratase-related protein [Marinobacterium sp. LSUCC0821]QJD71503.1 2-(1,2-epoxy-1,2-dihydrophenyl)acetyl-CoA isomerase [Marinobacterium sp. LSUCC0821]